MEPYPDEEDMGLDNKKQHHQGMVFEDSGGGVGEEKTILHANIWYVYMKQKWLLIKGGYYVEGSGYYWKKVVWEFVEDHVVEGRNQNYQIVLQGFGFNLFEKYQRGGGYEKD